MKIYTNPDKEDWGEITKRKQINLVELDELVEQVFNNVQINGDAAVLDYTEKFDAMRLKSIKVSQSQINLLAEKTKPSVKKSIDVAYANIKKFHLVNTKKDTKKVETTKGVFCWKETRPIENVGLYVPGGSAPLISTVLMLGLPSKLAGCKNIVLCTPPNKLGSLEPAICYALEKLGIKSVFAVGGVQAIAAMSLGTKTIPKVDKIYGPGNQYVMAAKQFAGKYGVSIDMPAGPSEVMVIADESARADFVAADLLSQAEHGPDSQVVLVTSSPSLVKYVRQEIARQVESLPRKEIAKKAINNSFCVIIDKKSEIVDFTNSYAPEHLIINTKNPEIYATKIVNAGSVFLGEYSPESAGDYASGTNHTLPTSGWAKTFSGLSVTDFQKDVSFQQITKQGLTELSSTINELAQAEGLAAHARAVLIRLDNSQKTK